MIRLYEAESDAMNYLILEDTENDTACVFNWDLSDEEISEIVNKFENDTLTEEDFYDTEWRDTEEVFPNYYGIKLLAY